jgi:hypothetical protein
MRKITDIGERPHSMSTRPILATCGILLTAMSKQDCPHNTIHRLAAIEAAEVGGNSRLMEPDQVGTPAAPKSLI